MVEITGVGKRVRIYIGELDKAEGQRGPLWECIMNLLREEGAAGATLFRGLAGFGAHSKLHLARFADIIPDLPVVVEWIDGPERVERLLPRICDRVASGTITVEDINIVKYAHRAPRPLPPDVVGDVMTREVVVVHPRTPLGEAVRTLLGRDYRALPVVDDAGTLVGILTNTDLIERGGLTARLELLAALGGPAAERELTASGVRGKTVGDAMNREVLSVSPRERLDRAAHLMAERKIKRLPVVDDSGRLVGIVSRVDVLRTMGEDYRAPERAEVPPNHQARVVGEVMRRDVPAVRPEAPIGEVLDAVTSTRLNRAVVVDGEDRVQGIITDADLLARLDPGAETGLLRALMGRDKAPGGVKATARDVMRLSPITAAVDLPIGEAVRVMLEARRKVLPITDADGRLLGIADRADLLASLRPSADTGGA